METDGKKNAVIEYIDGRECAIIGLGVSNLPLAKMLCDAGLRVNIYDKKTCEELGDAAEALRAVGAHFFVSADKSFEGIEGDVIFRSPGTRPDARGIVAAQGKGAELISETELFLKLTKARTYAITGSDGKTTTTTLTGKFLDAVAGDGAKVYVGGNIGTPLLDKCADMSESDIAVLELSSFQLMTLGDAPERVAVTNISPNHLDWHTGMEEYIAAKKNIIGERTRRLVTNADCDETLRIAREACDVTEVFLFSSRKSSYEEIFGKDGGKGRYAVYVSDGYIRVSDGVREEKCLGTDRIRLPGRHNLENYMTAIALTFGDAPYEIYGRVAESFAGVEHRLEWIRELDGVSYYNSSIDSSPTRTAAALSALSGKSIILICGGYDKKIPYEPLAEAICSHGGVKAVALTGQTGEKIGEKLREYAERTGEGADIFLEYHGEFEAAALAARDMAKKGDIVLLSPASASFDAFKNFAERGDTFRRIVESF